MFQINRFCKDKDYNYKYGELNPFYSIWSRQQSSKTAGATAGGLTLGNIECEESEEAEINWESFWSEYEEKYAYPPKKAIHLWK